MKSLRWQMWHTQRNIKVKISFCKIWKWKFGLVLFKIIAMKLALAWQKSWPFCWPEMSAIVIWNYDSGGGKMTNRVWKEFWCSLFSKSPRTCLRRNKHTNTFDWGPARPCLDLNIIKYLILELISSQFSEKPLK